MDTDRLITGFTAHWRLLGHSPRTLDCYLGVLRRLPKLDCDAIDVHQYLGERAEKVSAATLAVDVRALRSFYGWRAETLDCDNPAAKLKTPKVHEAPIRVVSHEDYVTLLTSIRTKTVGNRRRAVDRRDRAIIACFWSTGVRLAEMARIELDDLDLAGGVVAINRTKARRPRSAGLSEEARKELRAYLRLRLNLGDGPRLWLGAQGPLSPEGVRQVVIRRSERAGVTVSPHDFRRAIAERWLAAGGSETLLRAHQGWSSPAMVARYTSANSGRLAIEEHRRLIG